MYLAALTNKYDNSSAKDKKVYEVPFYHIEVITFCKVQVERFENFFLPEN